MLNLRHITDQDLNILSYNCFITINEPIILVVSFHKFKEKTKLKISIYTIRVITRKKKLRPEIDDSRLPLPLGSGTVTVVVIKNKYINKKIKNGKYIIIESSRGSLPERARFGRRELIETVAETSGTSLPPDAAVGSCAIRANAANWFNLYFK